MPLGRVFPIVNGGCCHLLCYKASRGKNQILCVPSNISGNAAYRLAVMLLGLTYVLEGIESDEKVCCKCELLKEVVLALVNANTGLVPF